MAVFSDAKTRSRIVDILKRNDPMTARELAETLGLTPMAVRLHLHELRDAGVVAEGALRGGRGRPAAAWELAEGSSAYFPDRHADLATELLLAMREELGPEQFDAVIRHRMTAQTRRYSAELADQATLGEKVARLAELRSEEGYMASVAPLDDGFALIEDHCPICTAAAECAGFCAGELESFQTVLGETVVVTRTEHLFDGARRCAYSVLPASGADLPS